MVNSKSESNCVVRSPFEQVFNKECVWTGVQLYHRICPSIRRCWETFTFTSDSQMLLVKSREAESHGIPDVTGLGQYTPFCTNGILDDKCQEEVFEALSEGLAERTFSGRNTVFMAVGPPGSGKTYTVAGLGKNRETQGLLPRVACLLVREAEIREDQFNYKLAVSFLEYTPSSETLIDLNSGRTISLKGGHMSCIEIPFAKESEVLKILSQNYNKRSTLQGGSHDRALVITFSVHLESKIFTDTFTYHPKVIFVELPGWRNDSATTKLISDCALYLGGVKPPGLGRTANKFVSFLDNYWHSSRIKIICHYQCRREDRKTSLAVLSFCDALSRQHTHVALVQKVPDTEKMLSFYKVEVKMLERTLNRVRRESGYHGTNWLSRRDVEQIDNHCKKYLSGDVQLSTLLTIADPDQLIESLRNVAVQSINDARSSDIELKKKDSKNVKKEVPKKEKKMDKRFISASVKTASALNSNRSVIPENDQGKKNSDAKAPTPVTSSGKGKVLDEKAPDRMTVEPICMPPRELVWKEFFTRYPELTNKLNVIQKALYLAEEDRDTCYEEFKHAREELRMLKLQFDDAKWKRKMESGDKVDWLGRVIMSDEERDLIDEVSNKEFTYQRLKNRCYDAVKTQKSANMQLLELKSEIEHRFDEYCRSAYGNLALTFEMEEIKDNIPCWPNQAVRTGQNRDNIPVIETCSKGVDNLNQ